MSLKGKNVIVTGGASGIGLAISQRFGREGASVAVWDIDETAAQRAADEIKAAGGTALACRVDVSKRADLEAAVAKVRADFGPVDILVNNAGVSRLVPFLELSEDDWDNMMAVNLKAVFVCTQLVLPDMVKKGWGRVINISSSSAQMGARSMSHYVASKGGVVGLTKALALEFAEAGITVNNVPPGFVETPMLRNTIPEDIREAQRQLSPMKRPGRPENIAAACAFLASDDADYITGHTFSVNGGRYLS